MAPAVGDWRLRLAGGRQAADKLQRRAWAVTIKAASLGHFLDPSDQLCTTRPSQSTASRKAVRRRSLSDPMRGMPVGGRLRCTSSLHRRPSRCACELSCAGHRHR